MRAIRLRCLLGAAGLVCLSMAATVASAPSAQAATNQRTVKVVVVPALAGVAFTLNGVSYVTGTGGVATVPDSNLAGADQSIQVSEQQIGTSLKVSKDRVINDPNHGSFARLLIVELDESRPVAIQLLTPQHLALPASEISSVTLSDSLGRTTPVSSSDLKGQIWLSSSRPARTTGGIGGRLVVYSVKSVMIRGTNVVNSGQFKFTPSRTSVVKVPVILHSLTVDGNDLLAGTPAGSSVQITYPDQTTALFPFASGHRITIPDLPRGTYKLKLNGGLIPLASTVRLSRNQTVTEIVVTGADLAEMVTALTVILAILVAAGIIGRRLRQRAASARAATGGLVEEPAGA
jgi:hypothetical protein